MFELFAFILITKQILLLNIDEVASVPGDGEIKKNDVPKEDDEIKQFLRKEPPQFSLSCVLFQDLGCDSECYVKMNAFGRLGAGVCVDDNRCDCGYPIYPTLTDIWMQKFPHSREILNEIIASNDKLANTIHRILAQPFRTTKQSKDDLKPHLSDEQFNKLEVFDIPLKPADKFVTASESDYKFDEMLKHVNEKLPFALRWRDADLNAVRAKYKPRLTQALDEAKNESRAKLERIVHLVRRVKNDTLNDIVDKYLTRNNIRVDPEYENITGIDKNISYIVVDELVKRVDKGAFQIVVGWIRTKVTSLLNKFRTTDNDRPVSEVLATSGSISYDWRKDGKTIRYRYSIYRDETKLAWVKNSDRVCTFIGHQNTVGQSWMFGGKVIINLSKIPTRNSNQYWKFVSLSYQYHDEDASEEEWNNGVPNDDISILEKYKIRIDEWCAEAENSLLIERKYCIIYE